MASEASLHRRALVAVAGAFALVLAGGLVTSRDVGLAVPDWPLAFGQINPPGWWRIESIRTEHGHRILAFLVASWTAFLLVGVLRASKDRLARRLAVAASGLVILQALLGGLRVLKLSVDLAMVHGVVGQVFFATLACTAAVLGPRWRQSTSAPVDARDRAVGVLLVLAVFAQLLLGLFLRHLGAAARPLGGTLLFYAHVAGAGLVLSALLDLGRNRQSVARPGDRALLPLVVLQVALGVATWIATDDMTFDRQATMVEAWVPTLHVAIGAALLAFSVVRSLNAWCSPLASGRALEAAR